MLVAEQHYKIYDFLPDTGYSPDKYLAPHHIDFRTSLTQRLYKVNTISQGELVEVIHYADWDGSEYSTPVVRETFSYVRDEASGLAESRTNTVEWNLVDGTIGPHPKVLRKRYSTVAEKRHEIARKRANQIDKASETLIGALAYGGMGIPMAISEGQTYWVSITNEVIQFEAGDPQKLRDKITADSASGSPAWLSEALRDILLAELV